LLLGDRFKNAPRINQLTKRFFLSVIGISAATLARGDGKQVRIVPLADHENDNTGVICLNSDDEDGQDYDVIRVPLPYSLHTPAYDNKGNPWTDDPVLHQQPDAFGRHGLL
jgi:hypothetical protein